MILTIAPNPAVDLTWHVDGLTPGATHRMPPGISRAGGKGLNAAQALHQTGHEVLVLAAATRRSLAIVDHACGAHALKPNRAVAATVSALATGHDLWSNTDAAAAARAKLARRATAWPASAVLMPLACDLSPKRIALADKVLVAPMTEGLR